MSRRSGLRSSPSARPSHVRARGWADLAFMVSPRSVSDAGNGEHAEQDQQDAWQLERGKRSFLRLYQYHCTRNCVDRPGAYGYRAIAVSVRWAGLPDAVTSCHRPPFRLSPLPLACPGSAVADVDAQRMPVIGGLNRPVRAVEHGCRLYSSAYSPARRRAACRWDGLLIRPPLRVGSCLRGGAGGLGERRRP